jgi:hypothetical protein
MLFVPLVMVALTEPMSSDVIAAFKAGALVLVASSNENPLPVEIDPRGQGAVTVTLPLVVVPELEPVVGFIPRFEDRQLAVTVSVPTVELVL